MTDHRYSLLRRDFAVPPAFHEVMGQRQTVGGVVAVIAAVGAFSLLWGDAILPDGTWQNWLAFLIALDIVAGAVANFTRGTNDFYAERPISRWVFIAVHIHLPVIGWALGWDMASVLAVWLGTVACASLVNVTGNRPVIGGLCLALGLMLLPKLGMDGLQLCLSALFFLKVTYSFAVDHGARGQHAA
jgi:hypothetical protein